MSSPTPSISESHVDVLIIGAGPAGVMACNALARNGVNVRIIDQRPVKVAAGQADGIQPRTIEVLQSYGLAQRLLQEGNRIHMAAFYNPGLDGGIELSTRVPDVTAQSARYPFEVTLHQGAIESIFLDSMHTFGVSVNRPYIPVSIELSEDKNVLEDVDAYPVKVVLRRIDDDKSDSEVVHAKFVIGADGAHSWVRKAFNIAMEGEQTEYVWGVIDFTPDTDFPDIRNKCVIHSNNGTCMIIPREGDKVRLYIQLDSKNDADTSTMKRVDKSRMNPHQLFDVAMKSFQPYTFQTPDFFDWWTVYIIGQRVASKFSVEERLFIVGDACHTHSPKAGQGMNASMNDSHNLAWKLTHVLRGWAKLSLLKTYELERRKYAQDLIDFDKHFSKLFSGKLRTEENQDGVSHEFFLKIFQAFGGFTSGIGICYTDSLITDTQHQSYAKNLVIGQRVLPQVFLRAADCRPFEIQDLLPSDARFKIILFIGDTSDSRQLGIINVLANELEGVLAKLAPLGHISTMFDILAVCSDTKTSIRLGYKKLPLLLRSHWSRVFIDDKDLQGTSGGDGYKNYGIDNKTGAIVIVRPDGYVGMISPLDKISDIDVYFGSFAISLDSSKI